MAYPHLNINTENVILEKMLVSASASVSSQVLRDLAAVHRDHTLGWTKVHQELSPYADRLLVTLSTWILKGQHVETVPANPVTVPTTWWDHLKHDMLASKKGWVVWVAGLFKDPNYTTIFREDHHITHVCPHNDTYFSDSQQHINYLLWKNDKDLQDDLLKRPWR